MYNRILEWVNYDERPVGDFLGKNWDIDAIVDIELVEA
jgi:hypothetical protein